MCLITDASVMTHLVSDHLNYMPHIYNSHFLPSLPANQTREDSSLTFRNHPQANTAVGQQPVSSSDGLYGSVVNSDDADRRFSRKTLARRQLVGGLTTTNLIKTTQLPRRTLSFRINSELQVKPQVSLGYSNPQRHSSFLSGYSPVPGKSININVKKTREVIETWNKLVQDIHSYHHDLHPDNTHHLAVLSDTSSQESTPTSDKVHTSTHKTQVRTLQNSNKRQLIMSRDLYNEGLGFTRYRPITPNLLSRLDSLKLPSHRLTQLWVNQLPERRRSYQMTCPPMALSPSNPPGHHPKSKDQWSNSSSQQRHDFI